MSRDNRAKSKKGIKETTGTFFRHLWQLLGNGRISNDVVELSPDPGTNILRNVSDPERNYDASNKNYVDLGDAYLQSQISALDNVVITGSITWTGTGFIYRVTRCTYRIQGIPYTSSRTQITLSPSDATHNRIDVVYLDSNGQVGVAEGTPDASPIKPTIDTSEQIELTFIVVEAGTTEPAGISFEQIYNENTEWVGSFFDRLNGLYGPFTVNFENTTDPVVGSVSAYANIMEHRDNIKFTKNIFFEIPATGNLVLYIKLLDSLGVNSTINFSFFNLTTLSGNSAWIGNNQVRYGVDPNLLNVWQLCVIPITEFNTSGEEIDVLLIEKRGSNLLPVEFYLDDIKIESSDIIVSNLSLDLNALVDVTVSSPVNGETLVYNSTTKQWENAASFLPLAGGTLIGNLIMSGSEIRLEPGKKIYFDGSGNKAYMWEFSGQLFINTEDGYTEIGGSVGGVKITAGQNFEFSRLIARASTRVGPGAIAATQHTCELTTTGTGDAITLGSGVASGQILTINYVAEGDPADTAILIPASRNNYASITFNTLGDSVTLQFGTGGWTIIGFYGSVGFA
jgi:hypothetical protein